MGCGHCKQLAPQYQKAAQALKGIIGVGAVDCDVHKQLCGQYGVQGFPTIKVFGANKNKPEDYQGGRTADAIVQAAQNLLKNLFKTDSVENLLPVPVERAAEVVEVPKVM